MQFSLSPKRTALQFLEEIQDRHSVEHGLIVVAWARLVGVGLLHRTLADKLKNVRALIGVSDGNTSAEAIHALFLTCRSVHIFDDAASLIFHPKAYVFSSSEENPSSASVLVGSSNLTGGGLVTNYEGNVEFNLNPSTSESDKKFLGAMEAELGELWNTKFCRAITSIEDIESLVKDKVLRTEGALRRKAGTKDKGGSKGERKKSKKATIPPFKLPFKIPYFGVFVPGADDIVPSVTVDETASGPALAENYLDALFVRTLTGTDLNKLKGAPGTLEPDLTLTAREIAPGFWGWPDKFQTVVHEKLPRAEWATGAILRQSEDATSKSAEVNFKQWFRPKRTTINSDGEDRQHAAEHRFQIGPKAVLIDIVPGGFDADSLIVFRRKDDLEKPFEIFFVLPSDERYGHFNAIASTQRPQHRFGYWFPDAIA